jgi:hypothetical protein
LQRNTADLEPGFGQTELGEDDRSAAASWNHDSKERMRRVHPSNSKDKYFVYVMKSKWREGQKLWINRRFQSDAGKTEFLGPERQGPHTYQ